MRDKLLIARGVVKALAILVGMPGTVLCLMALVGRLTANGWVRGPLALLTAVLIPALLADRLLPNTDDKPKGVVGDVFALFSLGFVTLFAVALGTFTRSLLTTEADRLAGANMRSLAAATYLLAGADVSTASLPAPSTNPTHATTAASPTTSALAAPPPSATASTSAAPATSASAAPATSASAAPTTSASAAPAAADLSAAAIFKRFAPAVVTIRVNKGPMQGGGTGFLLDHKGTIATNNHVIDGAQKAEIRFMSGASFERVWVLLADPTADLALLRVDLSQPSDGAPVDVEPAVLGRSETVTVGERAISIGNPLGLEHTLTTGVVSARRTFKGKQWIQMSTPISPGNSGGPVFNGLGQVIAVTTASIGGGFGGLAQNLNLAVPIDVLTRQLANHYPGKHELGHSVGSTHW